ncbi:universal stress protein [uncultured Aliiroseovarius sp.]|uniref:universal stress protein n=1 Tax=uncultured Aliiroseovarius sp. TaxID=1658783 RepID=UPI002597980D|nr:universal stress protein [uncultured Aliiroseovarius sp.]
MPKKIVVGYDDSDSSKATLDFAIALAKSQSAAIVIAHVLEWSPYSFLTPNEIEERHKRRNEELHRAETAVLAPVVKGLEGSGVEVSTALKYGGIADTLCDIVKAEGAVQIVVGRTGSSGLSSRIFGSVAGTLAQISPVPVTIVP